MSLSNLSLAERDRRWNLVRQEMEKRGLSCLVISHVPQLALGEWLVNDVGIPYVLFPLDGEPAVLISSNQRQYDISLDRELGSVWVDDYRLSPARSEGIIEWIKELHLENTKIGITGGGERSKERVERSPEGNIPYGTLTNIYNALPKARFEDVTWWMCECRLPQSEEELKIIRRASDILELACYAYMDAAKPGVRENEVYAAANDVATMEGTPLTFQAFKSFPAGLAAGQPLWAKRGVLPRILKAGDIVTSEFSNRIGYYAGQVNFCVGLKPVDDLHKKLDAINTESIEASMEAMKPGVKWSEVCDASEAPMIKHGVFTTSPNIHSMNPTVLRTTMALDFATMKASTKERTNASLVQQQGSINYITKRRGPDVILKKGMCFEIEPGASLEDHRVLSGGLVVMGEKGTIKLNQLAFKLQIV